MPKPSNEAESRDQDEFLRAELRFIADSFLRNEEQGERRVNVFLGLVAALVTAGGLAVDAAGSPAQALLVMLLVTGALLPIGWMTLSRLVRRNLVTTDYLRKMDRVRQYFLTQQPGIERYLPFPPSKDDGPWRVRKRRYGVERGGLVEIVAFTNSLLAGGVAGLATALATSVAWLALLLGAVASAVAWVGQLEVVCRRYAQEHPSGTACPDPPWKRRHDRPSQTFRANVGIIVLNQNGHVLALERADAPGAWQLPQGGLWIDEEPKDAARRELQEETGLLPDAVELIAEYPEWLPYELPPRMSSDKTGRGQVQKWFLYRLKDASWKPSLPKGRDTEFRSWKWAPLSDVVATSIAFRRPIYERLAEWCSGLSPVVDAN